MPESEPQATSASPLIIISYSREDETWRDQLVSFFPTDIDLQLMFNRVEDQPQSALSVVSQLVRIDEKLMEREVLVLLLSPSYLRTSWILTEQTDHVLELERQYGLTILPVLLHDCSLEDVPFLRNRHVMSSGGKPFAATSLAEQATALQNLASQILQAAGVAEPPQRKSSEQAPSSSSPPDTVSAKELEKFRWTTEVDKILNGAKDLGGGLLSAAIMVMLTQPLANFALRSGAPGEEQDRREEEEDRQHVHPERLTIPGNPASNFAQAHNAQGLAAPPMFLYY